MVKRVCPKVKFCFCTRFLKTVVKCIYSNECWPNFYPGASSEGQMATGLSFS